MKTRLAVLILAVTISVAHAQNYVPSTTNPQSGDQILQTEQKALFMRNAGSLFRSTAQGATKAQIKSKAGTVYGYNFVNANTYPVYVKLYDNPSASVTVGTTVPVRTIVIPASGFMMQEQLGVALTAFTNGITIAVTKNLADTDTTVLDTAILAEVFYK